MDIHTNYEKAVPLRSKWAEDIWLAFIEGWASIYVSYPNIIRLDKEASFTSELFTHAATDRGLHLQFSGTESHNSIGSIKRYHTPLLHMYRIARDKYPSLNP